MNKIKNFFLWNIRLVKQHKIISIIAVVIVLTLFYFFRPKPLAPIDTITVKQTNLIQSISVSGSIAAKNIANLSPLSSAPLIYVGARVGDTVSIGQTIAILDQRIMQKNLETSLITYAEQRNSFDQIIANNNGIQKENDALSDSMKRILENNQFDLDKSVRSVELLSLTKQQSILTSPIKGVVTRADAVSIGTSVTAATVFTIVDPTSLIFNMDVDEADVGKIKEGQTVTIKLDAFPNESLSLAVNRIDFVSHATSNGGNAFTVEVKLPTNNQNKYRVGINGSAEIITDRKDAVLTIPISSIFDTNKVYTKTKKGYEKHKVVLGLQNDTDTEVTKGLSQRDIVVTQPSSVPVK